MRTKINLNHNWLFHLGELKLPPHEIAKKAYAFGGLTAALPAEKQSRLEVSPGGVHFLKLIAQGDEEVGLRNLCNTDLESSLDNSWRKIDLPHDWKVEIPYENNPQNLMEGSKPDDVGYYRKRFGLSEDFKDKKLVLDFEGVSRMADVWLNGAYLGHNNSGYTEFEFDVSGLVYFGDQENTLLVKADTTRGSEGWWYDGAGIYKNVSLKVLPKVHFNEDDLYVYTKGAKDGQVSLGLEFTLENETFAAKKAEVTYQVAGIKKTISLDVPALGKTFYQEDLEVENPELWSPENPKLYTAKLETNEDKLEKSFGIRTFKYDQTGFYLNGKAYELHGICEHQDFAGVGVALNQDILDFKVKMMKQMGVNAWRSSHNFAAKELLDACDRLGVIVINENRLPEATPWRLNDLEKMVKKTRMNASIAFWSLGNEELTGNTDFGKRTMAELAKVVKKNDFEHLIISAELLSPEGFVDDDYLKNFDILGINYPEAGVMGSGADLIKESHPDLPMMSTENASYFSTRGIYKDDGDKCQCNNFGSMYSMVLPGKRNPGDPGVGGTARPEQVLAYLDSHKYMGGVFLWTGFDYFGEPSPFSWPGISSQFGIVDLCGFPKDYYYYYKAHWTKDAFVHLMPHWNAEGLEIEDGKTKVRAFSNQASAELFLNGQSLGKKVLSDCTADWDVEYAKGTLEVKAYDSFGKETAADVKQTAGKTASLELNTIYEGQVYDLVAVQALDQAGVAVPCENREISFEIYGGKIVGIGNGDPADISPYSLKQFKLFNGKALIIVKKAAKQLYRIVVK